MKYLIVIILISALGFGLFKFSDFRNNTETTETMPLENPDSVVAYVKKNISKLSPEKETQGGTFYITNITTDTGTGTVLYEDGHNSYTADFTYEFAESGEVKIISFEIIE